MDDLRWFGKKNGRMLLDEAERELARDPLSATRNMKTLRPNAVAQRAASDYSASTVFSSTSMREHGR